MNSLEASYVHCRRVARTQARNFYYSFVLLEKPRRDAMCAIYAFMRFCDDLSDGPETATRGAIGEDGALARCAEGAGTASVDRRGEGSEVGAGSRCLAHVVWSRARAERGRGEASRRGCGAWPWLRIRGRRLWRGQRPR